MKNSRLRADTSHWDGKVKKRGWREVGMSPRGDRVKLTGMQQCEILWQEQWGMRHRVNAFSYRGISDIWKLRAHRFHSLKIGHVLQQIFIFCQLYNNDLHVWWWILTWNKVGLYCKAHTCELDYPRPHHKIVPRYYNKFKKIFIENGSLIKTFNLVVVNVYLAFLCKLHTCTSAVVCRLFRKTG